MRCIRPTVFLFALAACFPAAADVWTLSDDITPWQVRGSVAGAGDVSGAALGASGSGLLVSDETRVAQTIQFDRAARAVTAGVAHPLLPGEGKELDIEGITASSDGRWFFATGSHAVSRKTGAPQADRRHVFRIAAGEPARRPDVTTLAPVIEADPRLRERLGKSAEDGGMDIEGITERGGVLFFGLRSPSIAGRALVIEVRADDLFSEASRAVHRVHELALGEGTGIRDIARTREGFLLIAGPSGDRAAGAPGFSLHLWDGPGGRLSRVGSLPDSAGKPEALTVLEENDASMIVLVWHDGAKDGGPKEVQLLKRSR